MRYLLRSGRSGCRGELSHTAKSGGQNMNLMKKEWNKNWRCAHDTGKMFKLKVRWIEAEGTLKTSMPFT